MSKKTSILNSYYNLIKSLNKIPTELELMDKGITRSMIRCNFGSYSRLLDYAFNENSTIFLNLRGPINFNSDKDKNDYTKNVNAEIDNYNKIVVSAYANGSEVCKPFFDNLKFYCKKNNALLLIMPIAGPISNFSKLPDGTNLYWNIDPILHNELFVIDDLRINTKLFLSSIKLSTKHINPLTGLHRLSQKNGSFIYGSSKQFLDSVATSNIKIPSVLITSGVLNNPNYSGKFYMMNRTDKLAEHDHTIGAILVEVKDSRFFYSRQLQSGSMNEICDLGKIYKDNKVVKGNIDAIVLGDIHADELDLKAFKASKDMIRKLKPKYIVLHDIFNGTAVNHHTQNNLIEQAMLSDNHRSSLKNEIKLTAIILKELLQIYSKSKLVIVASNHNEFLNRYLEEGRYLKDHVNKSYATSLVNAILNDHEMYPLKFAINNSGILTTTDKERIVWLNRDEDFKIHGIELGAHGDKGSNGTKASMNSLERAYNNIICGHSHSPKIMRGVWVAGAVCKLKLDYNIGPSSWLHANVVLNKNGSRQMLTIINGEWTL
jgi:hypothetical protein